MKTTAIISEYNPFHSGHKYLIEQMKENGSTHFISIMSGNYVQRGECAIYSKWDRAIEAVKNGINLVIEIPTVWSSSSAMNFARAGVEIADAIGLVDNLAFGSECGDIEKIKKCADIFDDLGFRENLNSNLLNGESFPSAVENAMKMIGFDDYNIVSNPNDTLALEYVKALKSIDSTIKPIAVKRIGSSHDCNEDNQYPSSSYIRSKITNGEIKSDYTVHSVNFIESAIMYKLRSMNADDFSNLPDVTEGLENRIYNAVKTSDSLNDILFSIKSKRYPLSRIRRIILSAILNITNETVKMNVPYIKVLAFDDKGREILKQMKEYCRLPIIIKHSDIADKSDEVKKIYNIECTATDIFSLCTENIIPCGEEQIHNANYIK